MGCGLVVLVSGTGTLLQSLIDAVHTGGLDATILAVGADRPGTLGIERARQAGLPTFEHPFVKGTERAVWDRELTTLVDAYQPDLVVSAGFMKLVGADFLARFGGRMINTHPALLPAFPGMHGARDALAYGVKVSGATVFLVDAGVDSGTILAQDAVPVLPDDTVETLHERIKVVERQLLLDVVRDWSALSSHRKALP